MKENETNKTPLLPPDLLREFVTRHFGKRDTYLEMLEKEPSPLYVLDRKALQESAANFKSAFSNGFLDVRFYYAVKSNHHPDISAILLESGFGLDVSSGLELELALELDAGDIVFSGPGKTDAELTMAVRHCDRVTVLMDSFGELKRLGNIAKSMDRVVRTGIRLTTNPRGLWRKFGILPEQLDDFIAASEDTGNIRLEGIQFHTSWNLSPETQLEFTRYLGSILGRIKKARREIIRFIDIGGGYWPQTGEWLHPSATPEGLHMSALGKPPEDRLEHFYRAADPITVFAQKIQQAFREHIFPHVRCRVCFEPGRWICHDAMHLLMTVVDKKAPDLVITDAGTNAVGWERFETDYFPVLNLTRPALTEKTCHVLGSLCTPHDVGGYAYWGEGIEPGDVLMIPSQGAYTYSLRQQFIKPLPQVAML